jgi:hypothetical protein
MPYKTSLLSRFGATMAQVDEILAIHKYLETLPAKQIADNLLRAALTMLVSAIDTSIHELIISAIMYELREDKSIFQIEDVKVSVYVYKEADLEERLRLIESELRRQYAKESFQSSRQVENVISKIGISKIWSKLSDILGQSPEDIKRKLDLLVHRRNQIVHEGDLDHLHNLQVIQRQDLDVSLQSTRDMVNAIIKVYTDMIEAT